MFVADEAELVLPPLPPPPLPIFESRTAVPGTTVSVSEATARDTPIEQRMNAKRRRGLNKADWDEDVIFIGLVGSSGLAIQNYQVIYCSRTTLSVDLSSTLFLGAEAHVRFFLALVTVGLGP